MHLIENWCLLNMTRSSSRVQQYNIFSSIVEEWKREKPKWWYSTTHFYLQSPCDSHFLSKKRRFIKIRSSEYITRRLHLYTAESKRMSIVADICKLFDEWLMQYTLLMLLVDVRGNRIKILFSKYLSTVNSNQFELSFRENIVQRQSNGVLCGFILFFVVNEIVALYSSSGCAIKWTLHETVCLWLWGHLC